MDRNKKKQLKIPRKSLSWTTQETGDIDSGSPTWSFNLYHS